MASGSPAAGWPAKGPDPGWPAAARPPAAGWPPGRRPPDGPTEGPGPGNHAPPPLSRGGWGSRPGNHGRAGPSPSSLPRPMLSSSGRVTAGHGPPAGGRPRPSHRRPRPTVTDSRPSSGRRARGTPRHSRVRCFRHPAAPQTGLGRVGRIKVPGRRAGPGGPATAVSRPEGPRQRRSQRLAAGDRRQRAAPRHPARAGAWPAGPGCASRQTPQNGPGQPLQQPLQRHTPPAS